MERTTELQLIRQCLDMLETDEAFASEESSVPVAWYLDPSRFEAERALMRGLPHMVAHTSQLPSDGSFLTRSVMDTPVLLTRPEPPS